MADLSFRVDVDNNGFAKVSKLKNDFRELDGVAKNTGKSMSKFDMAFGAFSKSFAAFAGAGFLLKLGKDAVMAQAGIESLELQFKPLLGSAKAAKDRIEELSKFAASTPFELPEIARASKVLETLTEGTLSTGRGLQLVGDAAAVAGVNFDELSIHVGRAFSNLTSNRAAGESLSRMQELGLISGETRNQIEDLQKVAQGQEAWQILRAELEKSEGAMEGLSGTLEGKLSTLSDTWSMFLAKLSESSGAFSIVKAGVDDLIESLEWWHDLITEPVPDSPIVKLAKEMQVESVKLQALEKQIADEQNRERGARQWRLDNLNEHLIAQKSLTDQKQKDIQALQKENAVKRERDRLDAEAVKKAATKTTPKKASKDEIAALKARQDAELDEMQSFLDSITEQENERAMLAEDRAHQILEMEELVRAETRDRTMTEWAIMRQNEINEHNARLEMLVGFDDAIALQKENHAARMADIAKKESDETVMAEQAKQDAYLRAASMYSQTGEAIVGTMSIVFGKNKLFSRAMIIAQGAQAVINGLATPPLVPLGLSLAALATAQTGQALSQLNNAKAFALGGVVSGGEQFIRVNEQGSESVLNARATRSLGRETIDLLNNGRQDLLTRGADTKPSVSIVVNGVLSRDVYENEIKKYMTEDMVLR